MRPTWGGSAANGVSRCTSEKATSRMPGVWRRGATATGTLVRPPARREGRPVPGGPPRGRPARPDGSSDPPSQRVSESAAGADGLAELDLHRHPLATTVDDDLDALAGG